MTPAELRKLADRLEHVSFQGCVAEILAIRTAAAEWEAAERTKWALAEECNRLRRITDGLADDNRKQQARVEALERIAAKMQYEVEHAKDASKEQWIAAVAEWAAALAGKE